MEFHYMRHSPSIIPGSNQDIHLVLDDFGHLGQTWREANVEIPTSKP